MWNHQLSYSQVRVFAGLRPTRKVSKFLEQATAKCTGSIIEFEVYVAFHSLLSSGPRQAQISSSFLTGLEDFGSSISNLPPQFMGYSVFSLPLRLITWMFMPFLRNSTSDTRLLSDLLTRNITESPKMRSLVTYLVISISATSTLI